jgi:hypothetical protein
MLGSRHPAERQCLAERNSRRVQSQPESRVHPQGNQLRRSAAVGISRPTEAVRPDRRAKVRRRVIRVRRKRRQMRELVTRNAAAKRRRSSRGGSPPAEHPAGSSRAAGTATRGLTGTSRTTGSQGMAGLMMAGLVMAGLVMADLEGKARARRDSVAHGRTLRRRGEPGRTDDEAIPDPMAKIDLLRHGSNQNTRGRLRGIVVPQEITQRRPRTIVCGRPWTACCRERVWAAGRWRRNGSATEGCA